MATKRAVQLFTLRSQPSSVIRSRQTPQLLGLLQAPRTISHVARGLDSRRRGVAIEKATRLSIDSVQKRWDSGSAGQPGDVKLYDFEDVLESVESPSSSRLLIDVREPHEFEANAIPTAINLPVVSQPDALFLSEEDFEDRFGFQKPPVGKEVVFYCKSGVRCQAAAGFARQAGYLNVGEYRGSWSDWERRGGPGTKSPSAPGGMGEAKGPVTENKPTARTGSAGEEHLGPEGVPEPPEGPMGKQ
ncbi:hypothetical protein IAQ61_000614 [Plenodomus lingam]|uniref:Rhodanese domain-containing protein n=1 Tax=Leptosphaeria maculans (strain JN3 / isolate v23.1.3 / race Av1-4-5-6-7-8) TaxID=985895 RepID=E5A6M7_LEPMJ|nr:hypothetical protein LEMA_P085110.1 [Plenodomus lingam JN3]KAH9880323.1 hypothetical protein IAQ61_000614 [Plenodomus lingam]CBX99272.1 hypothetical protein LEMA_P085110.1 [Plenodomus lingam JN3]